MGLEAELIGPRNMKVRERGIEESRMTSEFWLEQFGVWRWYGHL